MFEKGTDSDIAFLVLALGVTKSLYFSGPCLKLGGSTKSPQKDFHILAFERYVSITRF